MRVEPHQRFSSTVTLTPSAVAAFATMAGDSNPLHHDPAFASTTRFGRVIASGTHTSALLLGLTAAHFSAHRAMLGLDFSLRFRRPVYADETIALEWLIVRVTANAKLKGDVVELRGRVRGQDGRTALGAKGTVLLLSSRS